MEGSYGILFLWKHYRFYLRFSLSIIVFTTVAFLVHLVWKWIKFVALVNKLPSSKLVIYHAFHGRFALSLRRVKRKLSQHVYDFLFMWAYSFLFMKQGFVIVWAIFWPVLIVYRADVVEAILSNPTELEKSWHYKFEEPWLGNGLLNSQGTRWRNRRKFLTQAFHFNILKDFLPIINKQARIFVSILNQYSSEEFIDVEPYVKRCSLDIICESILGEEIQSQTEPTNAYAQSISLLTKAVSERSFNPAYWSDFIFKISPLGRQFYKHVNIVHEFAYKLIQEKKEKLLSSSISIDKEDNHTTQKRKAFLDLLLEEHIRNNSISEEEIREEVDTFTFGGHDTTSMAISWSMYLIGLHPRIQEKIRQELDSIFGDGEREITIDDLKEMKYLECVLKECMRLYPPVPFYGRHINQDIEFQGQIIPKGCSVFVNVYALHRDPDVFPNPEKFDPERFFPENSVGRKSFAYVPFSGGPRNCIGQRFALMEVKAIITSVLRKFKLRSLDPRDRIHVMTEVVLTPAESLRIEIRPLNYEPEKPPTYFYSP